MNKHRIKKLIIGLFTIFFVLITVLVYPLLTQEENSLSIINGICKLNIKDLEVYEYDSDSAYKYYLTKSKDNYEPISLMLLNDGWIFKDQMGSGYLFEKSTDDKRLTVGSRQFSKYYKIWVVPR